MLDECQCQKIEKKTVFGGQRTNDTELVYHFELNRQFNFTEEPLHVLNIKSCNPVILKFNVFEKISRGSTNIAALKVCFEISKKKNPIRWEVTCTQVSKKCGIVDDLRKFLSHKTT